MELPLSRNEEIFSKYSVRISRRYEIYEASGEEGAEGERREEVAEDERSRGTSSLVFCRDGLRGRWGKPRRI